MSCPRRPILAAVCAVLLLATVALWVDGYWTSRQIYAQSATCDGSLRSLRGAADIRFIRWNPRPLARRPLASSGVTAMAHPLSTLSPGYTHEPYGLHWYETDLRAEGAGMIGAFSFTVAIPMWAVVLPLSAGLWWFWRRPKAKAAFPIELARDTA